MDRKLSSSSPLPLLRSITPSMLRAFKAEFWAHLTRTRTLPLPLALAPAQAQLLVLVPRQSRLQAPNRRVQVKQVQGSDGWVSVLLLWVSDIFWECNVFWGIGVKNVSRM